MKRLSMMALSVLLWAGAACSPNSVNALGRDTADGLSATSTPIFEPTPTTLQGQGYEYVEGGQVFLVRDLRGERSLLSLPAACALHGSGCQDAYPVPGTPPMKVVVAPLAWSPDGAKALWISSAEGRPQELFVLDGRSLSWTFLFRSPGIYGLSWSPDGQRISFVAKDKEGTAVYVASSGGELIRPIPLAAGLQVSGTAWLSDRSLLIAGYWQKGADIFVVDTETAALVNLTDTPGDDFSPAVSPRGEHIAFVSNRTGKGCLFLMRSDGSQVVRLLCPAEGEAAGPVWSPDGAWIAFDLVGPDRQQQPALYLISPDGTDLQKVATGQSPVWSPDGRSILFSRLENGHLRVFAASLVRDEHWPLHVPGQAPDEEVLAPSWRPP